MAFKESLNQPERLKLVVVLLVDEDVVNLPLVANNDPVVIPPVEEALVKLRLVVEALVTNNVVPVAFTKVNPPVIEAVLVAKKLPIVRPVPEATLKFWDSLLLNIVKFADVSKPLADTEASGILKITAVVVVAILKSVPDIPVMKLKDVVASPKIDVVEKDDAVKPKEDVATHLLFFPFVWRMNPLVSVVLAIWKEVKSAA